MPKKLKRKYYTEEFKHQIVQLYENGKKRADILAEYEISGTSLDNWVKRFKNSGANALFNAFCITLRVKSLSVSPATCVLKPTP